MPVGAVNVAIVQVWEVVFMVRDAPPPPGMGGSTHNTMLIILPYMEVSFDLINGPWQWVRTMK